MQAVTAALPAVADADLNSLLSTVNRVPQSAAGLLAWMEHAADWEMNRRAGVHFPLQSPDAAIPPEEYSTSLSAALIMRERVADGRGEADAMVALFDAIVGALTSRDRLQ